ncbi:MAG TPA: hypothetical protein VGB08_07815 [Allosphingosinicella sp.]
MRRETRGLAACLALSSCMPSASGEGMVPRDIPGAIHARHFSGFREPPLWTPQAARGYRTRLRVTASGIAYLRGSVRIDEHADGRLAGHLVVIEGREAERTARPFRPTRGELQELLRIAEEGRIWTIYPEYWGPAGVDSICVDGIEFVLERVDARGYRFSRANVQCGAPYAFRRLAERIFEIAGEEQLKRLLR